MNRRQALRAVVAEAFPRRRRPIGPAPAERQRFRRAEDRDLPPAYPRKKDCPGCVAGRKADPEGRWPIGWCSTSCLRKQWRAS